METVLLIDWYNGRAALVRCASSGALALSPTVIGLDYSVLAL